MVFAMEIITPFIEGGGSVKVNETNLLMAQFV